MHQVWGPFYCIHLEPLFINMRGHRMIKTLRHALLNAQMSAFQQIGLKNTPHFIPTSYRSQAIHKPQIYPRNYITAFPD